MIKRFKALMVAGVFFGLLCFPLAAFESSPEETAWQDLQKSYQELQEQGPDAATAAEMEKFFKEMCPKAGTLADEFEKYQKDYPMSRHMHQAWGDWMDLLMAAAYRLPERRTQLERIEKEILADPKLDPERRQKIRANQLDRTPNVAERERLLRTLEKEYSSETGHYLYCNELLNIARLSDHPHSLEVVEEVLKKTEGKPGALREEAVGMKAILDRIGKPLELKFATLEGKEINLNDYRGKVVLLDFWATWCPPCVAGLPKVAKAYEKLRAEGFEVIGMSYDTERDTLAKFVKKNDLKWPQYFDAEGNESPFIKSLGSPGPPAYWLIDQKGVLVDVNAGEELEPKVKRLLAGNKADSKVSPSK